ncbi:hypothetical protein [Micromonospora sp. NPDC005171]|uniref:hypothetical protein n=1 Tax=Micromonospora sp. NPDC005171 TaxID=3156866 RepID=UPI0033B4D13E
MARIVSCVAVGTMSDPSTAAATRYNASTTPSGNRYRRAVPARLSLSMAPKLRRTAGSNRSMSCTRACAALTASAAQIAASANAYSHASAIRPASTQSAATA